MVNSKKKMQIRLSEAKLLGLIRESINKVLTELDWKTYDSARRKVGHQLTRLPQWDDTYTLPHIDDTYEEWKERNKDEKDKLQQRYDRFMDAETEEFSNKYGKEQELQYHNPYWPGNNRRTFASGLKGDARREVRDYNDGKYYYDKDKGWQLKQ